MAPTSAFTASIEHYLQGLTHGRGLSPLTVSNYRRQLTALADYLAQHQLDHWSQLTQAGCSNG